MTTLGQILRSNLSAFLQHRQLFGNLAYLSYCYSVERSPMIFLGCFSNRDAICVPSISTNKILMYYF